MLGQQKDGKRTTIYLPSKRYDIPKVIGLKVYTCFPCLIGTGVIVIPHFKTEIPGIVWVQLCYDQFNPRVCWFSPITIGLFTNMVSTCSLHPIVFHDIDMPIIFLYWLLLFRCKYHEMSAHFVGYINSINDWLSNPYSDGIIQSQLLWTPPYFLLIRSAGVWWWKFPTCWL